jgi:hypothetical protein
MAEENQPMSVGKSLRHLVVFQLKLALDALRDFAFSPLSIAAFLLDAILKPDYENSLTHRMMTMGQRSDRVINLFGEYSDREGYTVDQTFGEVEQAVYSRREKPGQGPGPASGGNPGDG